MNEDIERNTTHALLYAAVSVVLVLLLIGSCFGYFALQESTTKAALRDVAGALGATDESILAEHAMTWDLASRGLFLHFTTPLDVNTFGAVVLAFDPSAKEASGIDGTFIFTHLRHAGKQVRIDGQKDPFLLPAEKIPSTKDWRVTDQQGRTFLIVFYRMPLDKAVYTIDGKQVTTNIVTVSIQTR